MSPQQQTRLAAVTLVSGFSYLILVVLALRSNAIGSVEAAFWLGLIALAPGAVLALALGRWAKLKKGQGNG